MPWVDSSTVNVATLNAHDAKQIYNGLDCCLTHEIYSALLEANPTLPKVYEFSLAMQAPALEMMLRGWKISPTERQKGINKLTKLLAKLDHVIQRYAGAVWDKPLNPRSPKQLLEFFYGAMGLPEQWISQKGVQRLSTNRDALEKLEIYFHAKPVVAAILAYRDCAKQLEVLSTTIDKDNRWRTSYNIGGTETARWSSSTSAEGTGSNIQNINPVLRSMFISDPGFTQVGIDLEQTESRDVGWLCGTLFGDWGYLNACEAGDLHTTVCKLVWTNLPWTGDKAKDREIAEMPFYRHFSYRDMAKRGGHGSNYVGQPPTMAKHLKMPIPIIKAFQDAYFEAFPGIKRLHQYVAEQIQTTATLVTPFGRSRTFFGRPGDDSTIREGVAFIPQSTTADRLNLGLYKVWKTYGTKVQFLGQVHDAIYFQVPSALPLGEIISGILKEMEIPLYFTLPDGSVRTFIVPGEAKWGWNWGAQSKDNPGGLAKWKGKIDRTRPSILEQIC